MTASKSIKVSIPENLIREAAGAELKAAQATIRKHELKIARLEMNERNAKSELAKARDLRGKLEEIRSYIGEQLDLVKSEWGDDW